MSTCQACFQPIVAPRGRRGPPRQYCDQRCRTLRATQIDREARVQRTTLRDVVRVCAQCGVDYRAAHRRSKYCSQSCAGIQANKNRWSGIPRLCPICTGPLVRKRDDAYYTYCSPECGAIAGAATRRTGPHGAATENARTGKRGTTDTRYLTCSDKSRIKNHEGMERFHRREIFERDAWTCHLCGDQCDPLLAVPSPLAATIDHLVPLAHGGSHTRSNVKCAHYSCNTKRGSRSLAECA